MKNRVEGLATRAIDLSPEGVERSGLRTGLGALQDARSVEGGRRKEGRVGLSGWGLSSRCDHIVEKVVVRMFMKSFI